MSGEGSGRVAFYDADHGRLVASLPTGADADATAVADVRPAGAAAPVLAVCSEGSGALAFHEVPAGAKGLLK